MQDFILLIENDNNNDTIIISLKIKLIEKVLAISINDCNYTKLNLEHSDINSRKYDSDKMKIILGTIEKLISLHINNNDYDHEILTLNRCNSEDNSICFQARWTRDINKVQIALMKAKHNKIAIFFNIVKTNCLMATLILAIYNYKITAIISAILGNIVIIIETLNLTNK